MWIEIIWNKKEDSYFYNLLINFDNVSKIQFFEKDASIYFGKNATFFYFDSESETNAFKEGLKLALNGLDFVYEGIGHIKPLLASKNEEFYRYMMLKEALSKRK